jgi:hypothetical protein
VFARAFFGGRYWAPRYFGDGGAVVAAAETNSGGWRRRGPSFQSDIETQTEREARVKAERIRMGILPPDPEALPAAESPPPSLTSKEATKKQHRRVADPFLPFELARLQTAAYIDAKIARDLDEQDALHAIRAALASAAAKNEEALEALRAAIDDDAALVAIRSVLPTLH